MSLREDIEASLTEEASSASKERRTWTASAKKRNSDWEIRRRGRNWRSESHLEKEEEKEKVPGAGIEVEEAMEDDGRIASKREKWEQHK